MSGRTLGIIGIGMLAFLIVATFGHSSVQADSPSAATEATGFVEPGFSDPGTRMAWIEESKTAVRAKLPDPGRAQFRNVAFYAGAGVPLACGEVDTKTGTGGRGGYERFIAASDKLDLLESEMDSSATMDTVWQKYCR